jgi:hypothetical protein
MVVVAVSLPVVATAVPASAQTAPVANVDTYHTRIEEPLAVSRGRGVLANDSDPDGDKLTAVPWSGANHGSVDLHPNGSFTYTPGAGFQGYDAFGYRAYDGTTWSNIVYVEITVAGPPTAAADSYAFLRPRPFVVAAPGVLANDRYVGTPVVTLFTGPQHGRISLAPDGSFTYRPERHFNATDRFTYRLTTGRYHATGRVTLRVAATNAPPIAKADAYTTNEDTPLEIAAPGLLANDTDADGNPLQVEVVTYPSGDLDVRADGSFSYMPYQDSDGDDSFTYRISDGLAWSETVLVSIDVIAVNDPPIVEGEQYETPFETTLDVPSPGVLANDYDPIEFDALTASGPLSGPAHGTVALRSNGSFTYTPDAGFYGGDSFIYRVSDSQPGGTASADITVGEPTAAAVTATRAR